MSSTVLDQFIDQAARRSRNPCEPADCVLALAPLMLELIARADSFLLPQHHRSDPRGYSRNLIYDAPDASLSLYSIVWLPGQWTPVHDHGSWGVVGVVDGVLEERSYVRMPVDRESSKIDAGSDSEEGGGIGSNGSNGSIGRSGRTGSIETDDPVDLVRGGVILLNRGAVTSFVPNPDHIHVTGVPVDRPPVLSLHLYGRMMSNFNIYDVASRSRRRVEVAHNES